MSKLRIFFSAAFITALHYQVLAQLSPEYPSLTMQAKQHFDKQEYRKAAEYYSKAFLSSGKKGILQDRYAAACAWAMAGVADSAFFQLETLSKRKESTMFFQDLQSDKHLTHLRQFTDRWNTLITKYQALQNESYSKVKYPLLAKSLDSIYREDQKNRPELMTAGLGLQSFTPEQRKLLKQQVKADSSNQLYVTKLIDKYGWLGSDDVGEQGNLTIFLVIQHAHPDVQAKYLPIMKEAVKQGKARGADLALLWDRTELYNGRDQVYGSQVAISTATGESYVAPLTDPKNVDKRRSEVGLPPLSVYLANFGVTWEPTRYVKDLPKLRKTYHEDTELLKKSVIKLD